MQVSKMSRAPYTEVVRNFLECSVNPTQGSRATFENVAGSPAMGRAHLSRTSRGPFRGVARNLLGCGVHPSNGSRATF